MLKREEIVFQSLSYFQIFGTKKTFLDNQFLFRLVYKFLLVVPGNVLCFKHGEAGAEMGLCLEAKTEAKLPPEIAPAEAGGVNPVGVPTIWCSSIFPMLGSNETSNDVKRLVEKGCFDQGNATFFECILVIIYPRNMKFQNVPFKKASFWPQQDQNHWLQE